MSTPLEFAWACWHSDCPHREGSRALAMRMGDIKRIARLMSMRSPIARLR